MKKQITAISLAALMAISTMAGCSSSSKQSSESSASASSGAASAVSQSQASSEAAKDVHLQAMITSLNDSADGPFLQGVMKDYESAHPGVTIEPVPVAMNDLYTKLLTLATSGDMPDIFTMLDAYMANAVEMDMVQDMKPLLGDEWLSGTLDIAVQGCKVGDKLVFMPWQNNTIAMVYRKDLFEEKGIAIPQTWDEFLKVSEQLTEDLNGDGKIDRYGCAFLGTRNDSAESRFNVLSMTFGANTIKNDGGVVTSDIGSEKFTQALKYYTDMARSGFMPQGFVEIGYSEAYTMMAADQVCMFFGASNVLGAMYNANQEMRGKFGSFPMPHATGEPQRTSFGTLGMSISSKCENPEVAADFLKTLTNSDNSLAWNKITGRLPCRTEALAKIVAEDPVFKGFADSAPFATLTPIYAGTAEIRDIMGEAYQSIVAEGVSAEKASATALEKTQVVLAKYK